MGCKDDGRDVANGPNKLNRFCFHGEKNEGLLRAVNALIWSLDIVIRMSGLDKGILEG